MHRAIDTRILALGLLVVLALLVRPVDLASAHNDFTGSIPASTLLQGR